MVTNNLPPLAFRNLAPGAVSLSPFFGGQRRELHPMTNSDAIINTPALFAVYLLSSCGRKYNYPRSPPIYDTKTIKVTEKRSCSLTHCIRQMFSQQDLVGAREIIKVF